MTPEQWDPELRLGIGQIDTVAQKIGQTIRSTLPATLEDAFGLYGPIEITHIQMDASSPKGSQFLYFLSSLRWRPKVFFVGYEYDAPYFAEYVEQAMVRTGQFAALPRRVAISSLDQIPILTDTNEIGIAEEQNPVASFIKICELSELVLI